LPLDLRRAGGQRAAGVVAERGVGTDARPAVSAEPHLHPGPDAAGGDRRLPAAVPQRSGPAGARGDAEPRHGGGRRHQHAAGRRADVRAGLGPGRHRGSRLHHDRLDQPRHGAAVHRRFLHRGGVRRRAEPAGHGVLGAGDRAVADHAGIPDERLDGQGHHPGAGDRGAVLPPQ
ncbi:hypothetical protein OY671_010655, partial [Metschnikowia pulcherrima]